jgi:hypothetical protein
VSDLGRVRSLDRIDARGSRIKGRVLSPAHRANGYLQVGLHRGGKLYMRMVHALVCEAFRGLRPDGKEVRHLDGDKLNNHVSNLRWGTRSENELDKELHRRKLIRPVTAGR